MKRFVLLMIVSALGNTGGCATSPSAPAASQAAHGQVMAQLEQDVVVSLGWADPVAAGSELTVYWSILGGAPRRTPHFRDIVTGQLRVETILAPHLARALLVNGVARKGEWVVRR